MKIKFFTILLFSGIIFQIYSYAASESSEKIRLAIRHAGGAKIGIIAQNDSTNRVLLIGPLESGEANLPQTYWFEAKDESGNTFPSKLPTGYGLRPSSETNLNPHADLTPKQLEILKRGGVVGYSGPPKKGHLIGDAFPGWTSKEFYVDLNRWFQLKANTTCIVVLKFQQELNAKVIESNPLTIKL